jgi:hypothetical protein
MIDYLAIKYRDSFYEGSDRDFIYDNVAVSIVKARQKIQTKFIHLRPSEVIQEKRQKCCNKFKQEYRKSRSQEKPERLKKVYKDCSNMFEPIVFKKETTTQYIFRKLRNFF